MDESEDVANLMAFLAGTGGRISEAVECVGWADLDLTSATRNGTAAPSVHLRGASRGASGGSSPRPREMTRVHRVRA